jgi:hypothetical protein
LASAGCLLPSGCKPRFSKWDNREMHSPPERGLCLPREFKGTSELYSDTLRIASIWEPGWWVKDTIRWAIFSEVAQAVTLPDQG